MTRDPVKVVSDAIARHVYGHEEVWRAAAVAAIRAVAEELRKDAMQEEFLSDRHSLYVGAEQVEGWLE